jgi:hypothetical protein
MLGVSIPMDSRVRKKKSTIRSTTSKVVQHFVCTELPLTVVGGWNCNGKVSDILDESPKRY